MKKPAYILPEYENENEYDMKERKAIDIDELKKRSELYDEELSPVQEAIRNARERVSSSNLPSEEQLYLDQFNPEKMSQGMTKLKDEDGNEYTGDDIKTYFEKLQEEKRRQVEGGEISPQEIKKFLMVRNLIGNRKK